MSALDPHQPGSNEPLLTEVENGSWRQINGIWRQLHGSFPDQGASIEWHDFQLTQSLPWHSSFHLQSLEICLNYSGEARIELPATHTPLQPNQLAIYLTTDQPLVASRADGSHHRFLTFEFSPAFLARQFTGLLDGLLPPVRTFIDRPGTPPDLLSLRSLPPHLLFLRQQLLTPPVPAAGLPFWYSAKILELLASLLFQPNAPGEFFCKQHHRLNRELSEQILYLLQRDMANPPNLEMLSQELGRSPFFLSRIFSETTGTTIPAALRKFRIERAAQLLLDTTQPITTIAFEVGYASLGAFNKAFLDHHGTTPGDYRRNPPQPRGKSRASTRKPDR